ncbi:MAG: phosphoribosylformylglycinamidine synthase subunit PurS [Thermodesulfobacteriota bacterium]
MKKFLVKVEVKIKPVVLDPQGKAVLSALHNLGYEQVTDSRIGKLIELKIDSDSLDDVKNSVTDMCNKLLANTVIEDYSINIVEEENA